MRLQNSLFWVIIWSILSWYRCGCEDADEISPNGSSGTKNSADADVRAWYTWRLSVAVWSNGKPTLFRYYYVQPKYSHSHRKAVQAAPESHGFSSLSPCHRQHEVTNDSCQVICQPFFLGENPMSHKGSPRKIVPSFRKNVNSKLLFACGHGYIFDFNKGACGYVGKYKIIHEIILVHDVWTLNICKPGKNKWRRHPGISVHFLRRFSNWQNRGSRFLT